MVKALIITGFGINCENEMEAAYKNAGAETKVVHFNDLIGGKIILHDYDILNFPGGFSFGDDIASGKVMANKIRFKKTKNNRTFFDEIVLFLKEGKFILGVCNGFQILVQLGLLPNVELDFQVETSLEKNDSGKFEDRWVHVKINNNSKSPFLKGIDFLSMPVRHGEGKLIFKDKHIQKQIVSNELIALNYADQNGNITSDYPLNPNGSTLNIAGLIDKKGQILGLMPHPEAFLSFYNHPAWSFLKKNGIELGREKTGQVIFDNIVSHINSTK